MQSKIIIPVLVLVGLYVAYQTTQNSTLIIWAVGAFSALCAQMNRLTNAHYNNVIFNIWSLCGFVCFLNPLLGLLYMGGSLINFFVLAPLMTPEQIRQQQEDGERIKLRDMQEKNETQRQLIEIQSQQEKGNYGIGLAPLPPGGYKLLQIRVKHHDGTYAIYHSINLEHQARQMLENDPRIADYDIGIDSRAEWGRYATYN